MAGIDGMRFLGARPGEPADEVERVVAVALQRAIVKETSGGS